MTTTHLGSLQPGADTSGLLRSAPRLRYGLDGWLCAALGSLLLFGLIMVASASVSVDARLGHPHLYSFLRQVAYMGFGVVLGGVLFLVPLPALSATRWWLYGGGLALLVLVALAGVEVKGATRWLNLGIFRLQASEPARLAFVVWLSVYCLRQQASVRTSWQGLVLPLAFAGPYLFFLLREPDLGASVILLTVSLVILLVAGLPVLWVLAGSALLVVATAAMVVITPWRLARMTNFMDPWQDAANQGFQLTQSLIASGSGGFWGQGLGNSMQKLSFLPEMNTDFIFAIIAEELGFPGVALVVGLFAVVVWRGFTIASRAERRHDRFAAYLAYGLSSWLGIQAAMNMAVATGMMPTKGLTLPFVSFGGSSLVTACLIAALILRVDYENRLLGDAQAAGPGGPPGPRERVRGLAGRGQTARERAVAQAVPAGLDGAPPARPRSGAPGRGREAAVAAERDAGRWRGL